jgi:UDP-N-acetylmuramoyl-L-alanyl-D-glutamate--2,6-diaminopimelate ligase
MVMMENLRPKTKPVALSALKEFNKSFLEHADILVQGITQNASQVLPGDVFVALSGQSTHGAKFAKQAINSGAVAIITDRLGKDLISDSVVPVIELANPRENLGEIASVIYHHPSKRLKVFGITGTNGKTTTSWLLHAGLERAGIKSALFGTAGIKIGDISISSERTTPEADQLQGLLAIALEQNLSAVVMEVSSHAIALKRISGIWFEAVGFTNLSQDHLDFHGNMEEYFKVKQELFSKTYSENAFICESDSWGKRLATECEINKVTVGELSSSDWKITNISPALGHVDFDIQTGISTVSKVQLGFAGAFNAFNATLALAMVQKLTFEMDLFIKGMSQVHIPGRMEPVLQAGKALAIVDYAHTPEAIVAVIGALRQQTKGKIIAVLGAGGNRDSQKRALMGDAVSAADQVIITDDNPRFEDAAEIRKAIISGFKQKSKVIEIADRKSAIVHAVDISDEADTIVILGKGHENYQEIRDQKIPFSDYQIVSEALRRTE